MGNGGDGVSRQVSRQGRVVTARAGRTSARQKLCAQCGQAFRPVRDNQRYCCASHKSEAYRERRAAALDALQALYGPFGMRREHIEDVVERGGMAWAGRLLGKWGLAYDEAGKQWTKGL